MSVTGNHSQEEDMTRFIRTTITALATLGAGVGLTLVSSGTAQAAPPTCHGYTATIVGTSGNDEIEGTSGRDVIVGLAGNDDIDGNGGNDVICAGDGHDEVDGGSGNDWISGGTGKDRLEGGSGKDKLSGGKGSDILRQYKASDRVEDRWEDPQLKARIERQLAAFELSAPTRLNLAKATYERERKLWEEKITPQQDYLQAEQSLREAEIAAANAPFISS